MSNEKGFEVSFGPEDDGNKPDPIDVNLNKTERPDQSSVPIRFEVPIDSRLGQEIQKEIQDEDVFGHLSSDGEKYVAKTTREYRRVGGAVYYNSRPRIKNTWGNVSDDFDYIGVKKTGQFLKTIKEIQKFSASDHFAFLYVVEGNKVFDSEGNEVEPSMEGVFMYPKKEFGGIKRMDGKWIHCDITGETHQDFRDRFFKYINEKGFIADFRSGSGEGISVYMSPIQGFTSKIFLASFYSPCGSDGKFYLNPTDEEGALKESDLLDFDQAYTALNDRKEAIIDINKQLDDAHSAFDEDMKGDFDEMYKKYSQIIRELKDFKNTLNFQTCAFPFALRVSMRAIPAFESGAPLPLTPNQLEENIEIITTYSRKLPRILNLAARFYATCSKDVSNKNSKEDRQKAIGLLKNVNHLFKEEERWNKLDEVERQIVLENDKLLADLQKSEQSVTPVSLNLPNEIQKTGGFLKNLVQGAIDRITGKK